MDSPIMLWKSLDEILEVHLTPHDQTGIGKLNRLARVGFANIKKIGREVKPENSHIELIKGLTVSSLGKFRLAHRRKTKARAYDNPLVMINWQNVNYIVDGTHRLNTWKSIRYSGTFSVIRITPFCTYELRSMSITKGAKLE